MPRDFASQPDSAELSNRLGVRVEPIAGETNQYLAKASRREIDFSRIGKVHLDYGYAVGVTLPDGTQIGFRFLGPDPDDLAGILGVRVTEIRGECRQYLLHAPRGSVDFSRLGTIHSEEGYAIGVTLFDGMQVGFRYAGPSSEELSRALGVPVEAIEEEPGQYYVHANAGTVDFSRLGKVHTDLGYAVGVALEDGGLVGFRYSSSRGGRPAKSAASVC
jgi:hypothetical protein